MRSGFFLRRAVAVCVLAFVLAALSRLAAGQSATPPATIYLVRHAEKLTDGQMDLSPTGFKRAAVLARLFAPPSGDRTLAALPTPQVIIATHQSTHSNRPLQTVTPLAEALHLPVQSEVMNEDFAILAHDLLSGRYANQVVFVAWHHGKLPQLAEALGAVPPYKPWPETQFDRIWRIDYKAGRATLTDLPQGLLPGDSR